MTSRTAYSYIRMSNPSQIAGNSLERQLTKTREYSRKMGFTLNEDYRDIGVSAYHGRHIEVGQLGKFIEAVENGKIQKGSVLIIENLDRLSRQPPITALNQLQRLVEQGIDVHELHNGQVYTKETLKNLPLLLVSLVSFNTGHEENEKKSIRLRNAWKIKREKLITQIMTAKCPAWLEVKSDRSGYVLKEQESKIIRKIFDLCIDENMGAYAITRYLNENPKQFPKITRAQKINRTEKGDKTGWQKSYIIKILKNHSVCGIFKPRTKASGRLTETGDVYENFYPAVISKERFHLAQSKKSGRKIDGGGRKGEKFSNIFTKLTFCGSCGGAIHYRDRGESRHGGIKLVCSNAEVKHKCKAKSWIYAEFAEAFFNFVNEVDLKDIIAGKKAKDAVVDLTNKKQSILSAIEDKEKGTEIIFNQMMNASAQAQTLFLTQINKIGDEISILKNQHADILAQLADYQFTFNKSNLDELKELIEEIDPDADNNKIINLRRALNARIADVVEKIVLNTPVEFMPFEGVDFLSINTLRKLESKGIKNDDELCKYLETAEGMKTVFDMERTFTVRFKSKIEKIVSPYLNMNRISDNRRMEKFINGVKQRQEARAAQEAEAASKIVKTKAVKPKAAKPRIKKGSSK